MRYKIRWSPRAQQDMDAVWDGVYEASKDLDTTDRYVNELIREIYQKREYPQSGIPLEYKGLFTGYYSVNYKAYKAFYRVKDDYIEVLRIFMMKEDYLKKLFGPDFPEQDATGGPVFHESAGI